SSGAGPLAPLPARPRADIAPARGRPAGQAGPGPERGATSGTEADLRGEEREQTHARGGQGHARGLVRPGADQLAHGVFQRAFGEHDVTPYGRDAVAYTWYRSRRGLAFPLFPGRWSLSLPRASRPGEIGWVRSHSHS